MVKFRTNIGQNRGMTFQCTDVNKALACVAGIADGPAVGEENLLIFSTRGGIIVPEKLVQIILPQDRSKVTEFARKGMVYVMDAWVKRSEVAEPSSGFHRPDKR